MHLSPLMYFIKERVAIIETESKYETVRYQIVLGRKHTQFHENLYMTAGILLMILCLHHIFRFTL